MLLLMAGAGGNTMAASWITVAVVVVPGDGVGDEERVRLHVSRQPTDGLLDVEDQLHQRHLQGANAEG